MIATISLSSFSIFKNKIKKQYRKCSCGKEASVGIDCNGVEFLQYCCDGTIDIYKIKEGNGNETRRSNRVYVEREHEKLQRYSMGTT